jgi:hypothetical protein
VLRSLSSPSKIDTEGNDARDEPEFSKELSNKIRYFYEGQKRRDCKMQDYPGRVVQNERWE